MQTILDALPRDVASLFTLVLVIAFVVAVVLMGRRSEADAPKDKPPEDSVRGPE